MFATHWENFEWLERNGFNVNPNRRLGINFDELAAFIGEMEPKRDELDYEIDGVVVKVNSTALKEELERRRGTALGDRVQVSGTQSDYEIARYHHTGRPNRALTPVANLEPYCCGTPSLARRCTMRTRSSDWEFAWRYGRDRKKWRDNSAGSGRCRGKTRRQRERVRVSEGVSGVPVARCPARR